MRTAALGLLALVLACGKGSTENSSSPIRLTQVATGLNAPLFLTAPPGDASRLFVVEKFGAIRVIKNGLLLFTPFLDLSAVVASPDEEGLLGLAFHPDYANTGRFFVYYTDLNNDTRVSEFHVSADPDVADPTETLVLGVDQPATTFHKGGMLAFGPDGYLYIGLGDGGESSSTAQDLTTMLGKILRIDVNGAAPYAIPPGNPFLLLVGARPEIWSYGLRNPWRFSFDRQTGDLYIGDVGESRREEIDVATAASGRGGGVNFGWDIMEGGRCSGAGSCNTAGLTLPVLDYPRSSACTMIGGYVYRGAAIPTIQGSYFHADYCFGWVHSFRYSNGGITNKANWDALDQNRPIVSFGEDAAGELYLVSLDGAVLRIDPAP